MSSDVPVAWAANVVVEGLKSSSKRCVSLTDSWNGSKNNPTPYVVSSKRVQPFGTIETINSFSFSFTLLGTFMWSFGSVNLAQYVSRCLSFKVWSCSKDHLCHWFWSSELECYWFFFFDANVFRSLWMKHWRTKQTIDINASTVGARRLTEARWTGSFTIITTQPYMIEMICWEQN